MSLLRAQVVCVALLALASPALTAQLVPLEDRVFNEQLLRPSGQPVVPLFDGWYRNDDGTHGICFGYFNLNTEEAVDIPIGPNNYIVPEEYDGLQPTHFDPVPEAGYRRHFCVFSATVPADFGEGRVVWTLRMGGEELSTPGKLIAPYVLDEPNAGGRQVVPPALRFGGEDESFLGRRGYTAEPRTTVVGEPLDLEVWVDHPADYSWVGWTLHQGPSPVTFGEAEQRVARTEGVARTRAWFTEPGQYLLRVQSIYSIASFEYHCCWTNGFIPVTVTR